MRGIIHLGITLLGFLAFLGGSQAQLAMNFYSKSCPNAEKLIQDYVQSRVPRAPVVAAQLLRMHFHDCFVRGCDASILLNTTSASGNQTEKNAGPNLSYLTARGFDFIDKVKSVIEAECSGIVSCADIIALTTRDSVVSIGGPTWKVPTGRRDGLISNGTEALLNIPPATFNLSSLRTNFANKGLDLQDLVLLSGQVIRNSPKRNTGRVNRNGWSNHGGPTWKVPTGRRDGLISNGTEALLNIPPATFNLSSLRTNFANKGLDLQDLVLLSGAHTIGVSHCSSFSNRLYNFTGVGDADPSLDSEYAANLRANKCKTISDNTTIVEMDPGSATTFDRSYYSLLLKRRGLFTSVSSLTTGKASKKYITKLLKGSANKFYKEFALSMEKMGRIDVKTGSDGEIRTRCTLVNS